MKRSTVMLALVASIHVLPRHSTSEDMDGWDKPDHDAGVAPDVADSGG